MKNNNEFIKGRLIIERGVVFKITEVKNQKNSEGKIEPFIFYTPVFKNKRNQSMICSAPISSIDKTTIRLPLSKSMINRQLKDLTSPEEDILQTTPKEMIEAFRGNDFIQIASIVKELATEDRHPDTNISQTKKEYYKQGIKRLSQEIAVVLDITLAEASQKITSKLLPTT